MTTPFLSGLLSLVEADEEVALIPAGLTFLSAWTGAKDALGRAAAVAQLEGNVLAAEAAVPAALISQTLPTINTALQTVLAKAQATIAAVKPA